MDQEYKLQNTNYKKQNTKYKIQKVLCWIIFASCSGTVPGARTEAVSQGELLNFFLIFIL